jgi:hypothetical protein
MNNLPPPQPISGYVQQAQPPLDAALYGQEHAEQMRREMAPYLGTIATANAMGWTSQPK